MLVLVLVALIVGFWFCLKWWRRRKEEREGVEGAGGDGVETEGGAGAAGEGRERVRYA